MTQPSVPASAPDAFVASSRWDWLLGLPVLLVLLFTLVVGTSEMVHGQLLRLGDQLFSDPATDIRYFMLRGDLDTPACDPTMNVEALVQQQLTQEATQPSSELDAMLGGPMKSDAAALRKATVRELEKCRDSHALIARIGAHQTPELKAYRALEIGVYVLSKLGSESRSVMLLLMAGLSAVATTLRFHHICIRPPRYARDFKVQAGLVLLASGALLFSSLRFLAISAGSVEGVDSPLLHALWIALFVALALISGWQLIRPTRTTEGPGSWLRALESTPLFAAMALGSGLYFLVQGHAGALAIYIGQIFHLHGIFLNLGLFILAGMLLKQSRVMDLLMDLARPWRLSPETLTWVILLGASVATAYTGASGIFVIAAGKLIHDEIRAAGASRQFALAATAMSGSLGVVLRPCLLVVAIAALNKQVTTEMLYHWGLLVFLLSSSLFFVASKLVGPHHAGVPAWGQALAIMPQRMKALLPYAAIVAAVCAFYAVALDTRINEFSASIVIPVMLLMVLWWESRRARRSTALPSDRLRTRLRHASSETIGHIGALIMLMILTLAVGGVVERSEVMSHLGMERLDNVWLAMGLLAVVKVLLGMVMEPFGAVALVSTTLAPIAYANGIEPVHFWMMVLVAFELGYLLPPVALNQLLTRQVVGEAEIDKADREVAHLGFYRRHERWILPAAVMGITLLLVAFGPLAVQRFEVLHPVLEWWT